MPEFTAPQEGAGKQDCGRRTARRWLARHADRVQGLQPVYLGGDLSACQQVADAIRAAGGGFLLIAKPSPHKALHGLMQDAILEERTAKQRAGGKHLTCRCRWFEQAPLRDGSDVQNTAMMSAAMNLLASAVQHRRRLPRTALDQRQGRQARTHPLLRTCQDYCRPPRVPRLANPDAGPDRL